MKPRHWSRVLVGIALLALLSYALTPLLITEGPSVRMKRCSWPAGWSACGVGRGNSLGDTVSVCIVGTDTIVDLSFGWFKGQQIGAVHAVAGEFDEGLFRTYGSCTIGNGLGLTTAYVEPKEITTVSMTGDSMRFIREEPGMRVWSFSGRDLSFATSGELWLSKIHFSAERQVEVQVRRSEGATRVRLVF